MSLWVTFLLFISSLQANIHTFYFAPNSFLPHPPSSLCVSDTGEGGSCSPPRGGAGSVPAADRAKSGSSSCSTNLLPLWTGQDLSVHLSRTRPGSSLDCDTIGLDTSPPHPRGWHEGTWGMEGAQRRQREMGNDQGEGEREAVTAEGEKGHTDARYCAWWAEESAD